MQLARKFPGLGGVGAIADGEAHEAAHGVGQRAQLALAALDVGMRARAETPAGLVEVRTARHAPSVPQPALWRTIRAANDAADADGRRVGSTRPRQLNESLGRLLASTLAAILSLLAADARAKTVEVRRIDRAPTIDGALDDAAWQVPPEIPFLTQVDPVEGGEPSERTEVWIARDDEALYIGIHARDSDPDAILAREMTLDVYPGGDDRIQILLDPFATEQQGYFFQLNPIGMRRDALSEGLMDFRDAWDTVWYGDARIVETGWTCEFAIPFQSLPLDPDVDAWGFEVERVIRRRNEKVRWANTSQNHFVAQPGNIGTLRGMGRADGRGVDVKPSFSGTYRRDRISGDFDRLGRPGLDLFWRPTSQITAALTFNTDFSDAPVDDRQTNLTRFPLFFPETRDFFLQDANLFTFGGLAQNGTPFFSRNIGIVDDRAVNLDAGLKVTGRTGRYEFGLLHTQMGHEAGLDAQRLTVGRLRANILRGVARGDDLHRGRSRGRDLEPPDGHRPLAALQPLPRGRADHRGLLAPADAVERQARTRRRLRREAQLPERPDQRQPGLHRDPGELRPPAGLHQTGWGSASTTSTCACACDPGAASAGSTTRRRPCW